MTPLVAYVAHPVGHEPARADNLRRVRRWLAWLIVKHPELAFSLPWLPYCDVLDESPANRERGIRDDLVQLERCDAIVLVGGRMSPGMVAELGRANLLNLPVIDYLALGDEPPEGP